MNILSIAMGKLCVNAEATRVEGAPLKLGCYVLFDFCVSLTILALVVELSVSMVSYAP